MGLFVEVWKKKELRSDEDDEVEVGNDSNTKFSLW